MPNSKMAHRRLKVETFDLKDFFTNVPRRVFREDVQEALSLIRAKDPEVKWF